MSNNPLRILNCLHRSDFGGAQRRVVWVNNELRKHHIETTILFPKDSSTDFENFIHINEVKYVRIFLPVIRKSLFHLFIFVMTFPWVVYLVMRKIRSCQSDIVHVNGATNLQPVFAALIMNKDLVWHWNDTLTPRFYVKIVSGLLKLKKVKFVVATRYIIDHYKLDKYPYYQLHAPIPPVDEETYSEGESLRQSLSLKENHRIVGYVGHIVSAKGAREFIKTAVALLKEHRELHAVMIGAVLPRHREFADTIKQEIIANSLQERIHLLGFRENVVQILEQFDVFVFPSWSEACPIVVLQAMQAGNPIAATKVGEVPFMLEGTGLPIIEPKDVKALITSVNALLSISKEEREKIKQRLHHNLYKNYTLSKISANHLTLYRQFKVEKESTGVC